MMVRDFQSVIGDEARAQVAASITGKLPDLLVACVGGGSNAIGLFWPFLEDAGVRLVGVEAGGRRRRHGQARAPSLGGGSVGVLHGSRATCSRDDDGQITEAHSICAGLDYPGVGPEHAYSRRQAARPVRSPRPTTRRSTPSRLLTRLEGIMPALESAHAVAWAMRAAAAMKKGQSVVVGLSGRGDKDVHTVETALAEAVGRGASPAAPAAAGGRR